MSDIGSTIAGWFGGGGGIPMQPTDIAPQAAGGAIGTFPGETLGIPTSISSAATGAASAPTWQKLLTGGLLGAGELGNLLGQQKSNAYQNYLLNLAKNPAQLSAMVNAATQPLSQAYIAATRNQVQGDLAARGLAQSPGIFQTVESQALAPALLQQQQNAQEQVLASLGLPIRANVNNPQLTNLAPALAMFLRAFQPQGMYNPTTPPGGQTPATPGIALPDTSTWGLNLPSMPTLATGSTPTVSPSFDVSSLTNPFMTGTSAPTFDLSGLTNLGGS